MARQKVARNTVAILLWTLLLAVSPLLIAGAAASETALPQPAATPAGPVPAAPSPQAADPETDPTAGEEPAPELAPGEFAGERPQKSEPALPWPTGWEVLETGNSPAARTGHAMSTLPDGRVLLFGGMDENRVALGDTWVWDLATGASPRASYLRAGMASLASPGFLATPLPSNANLRSPLGADWTPIQPPDSPSARQGHSMATLPDGRVLLFGGSDNQGTWFNDLHVFAEGTWTPIEAGTSPAPAGRSRQNLWEHGGTVYVQGGFSTAPDGKTTLHEDLWLFDPETNNWKQGPKPPGFISPNARPIVVGDKAYLVDAHLFDQNGGTFFMFDMKQGAWEEGKLTGDWPHGERSGYTMVQVGSSAYLMGGEIWDPSAKAFKTSTESWVMDLQSLTWQQLEDMPHGVTQGVAVYDPSDDWLIIWGGKGADHELLPSAEALATYLRSY